jgi:nucleotide-binding universal stress UspA family protein
MSDFERNFLIAVDGSDQCLGAVRYLGKLMPSDQTKVTLFHVMNPIPESYWDLESDPGLRHKVIGVHAWEFQQEKILEDFLKKAKRSLQQAGYKEDNVKVVSRKRRVGVARDILEEARQGYTALVVGRTGLSKAKDLVFGSIANKLVSRMSGVPICVVGGRPDTKRVLVAMDRSEGAMATLDHVGGLFRGTQPELLLFHVIRGMSVFQPDYERLAVPGEESDWVIRATDEFQRAQEEIKGFLQEGIRSLEQQGVQTGRITTRVVAGAKSRAAAIVGAAKAGGYGTIVIGRRGASRVEEFVMGRVSNKVLQLAKQAAIWVVS